MFMYCIKYLVNFKYKTEEFDTLYCLILYNYIKRGNGDAIKVDPANFDWVGESIGQKYGLKFSKDQIINKNQFYMIILISMLRSGRIMRE